MDKDIFSKLLIPIPKAQKRKVATNLFQKAKETKSQKEAEAESLLNSIDDYLLSELGITLPEKDNSLQNRIFETSFNNMTGKRSDPFYFLPFFKKNFDNISEGKYEVHPISNLIGFIESGSRPTGGVSNIESGILSVGGEHVGDQCNVGIGTPKYISKSFHQKKLLTETKINDIILVKDGATTGKIGIIRNKSLANQNVNEHVFLIRSDKDFLNPFYLTYYLHSFVGQTQIKREITGATVTGLTKEAIRSISIPVPPIEIQNEIAEHIQQKRSKAKQLKQQAHQAVEKARQKVEAMILADN